MKKFNLCLFAFFCFFPGFYHVIAQDNPVVIKDGKGNLIIDGLPLLTEKDSLIQASLPVLTLPENYRNRDLPVNVDNSLLPYFRPIFNQSSMECGQASAVAYGFTYEIDRLRNLPANVPENQYPTHFVFNWSNQGNGSACAFFDSWNIIREVGTPNVVDYGGSLNYGGDARWMSGYEKYYNAMRNRMWEFYSIPLKDEAGLMTLKHWINDHLDGSSTGGVANFYCSYTSANQQLPPGTPEAGKYVITSLGTYANHGLCVVGYHDSIRWDYNNDGRYTNHIDINNDGLVDFRDWEIGGVKLANSYYASSWGNQGFAYLTYNALCRSLAQGGIWNQAVHINMAKEKTEPKLTYKVTLTHNSRNKIKVMAGISPGPNANHPEYIIDFPILNYQGGAKYMQGGTSSADKTLEFGLDVTPLLGFIESGQQVTFFLLVDEDDAGNAGTGMIDNWSVMDYNNGLVEIPCAQTNVPLVENGLTVLSLGASVTFNSPVIQEEELPPATINDPYELQMTTAQGTDPYRWYLKQNYIATSTSEPFPVINAHQLYPTNSTTGYASQEIDFSFPFYGKNYSEIFIHTDGYLMFEANEYPWTFVVDEFNVFKNLLNISPYMTKTLGTSGGGMWYEGDASKATFRWKAIEYSTNNVLNLAVSLYPDGKIELFYGDVAGSAWNRWYAGVSEGNSFNYELMDISNTYNIQPNTKIVIEPDYSFTEMTMTRDGLFHGTPTRPYEAVDIDFFVKDANGLQDVKTLPFFTDGINSIVIREVSVVAGDDNIIEYGESVNVTVELQNISQEVVNAQDMTIATNDNYVTLNDSTETLATFQPGETKVFAGAFQFGVSGLVPDNYDLVFSTKIVSDADVFNSHIYLKAYSPILAIGNYEIVDNQNGYLEPGETADIVVQIKNLGGGTAYNVTALFESSDPYITINTSGSNTGNISGHSLAEAVFSITADASTPIGYAAIFLVTAEADYGFSASDIIVVTVGMIAEDFETGTFDSFDWEFSGDAPWQIDQTNPYEGQYCMRSGVISHSKISNVFVTMNVVNDGEISFYYKVSSEPSYDFLRFSIDGSIMGSWSGEVGWVQAVYPVQAGERTFKWSYEKDVSMVGGSDCAKVDFIIFPPSSEQVLSVYAGTDINICEGQSPQLNATVINATSLIWSTSGDGTFSDPSIADPVYTPGNVDILTGSAELTITVYGSGGESLSDNVMVNITRLPVVMAGDDISVCEDIPSVPVSGNVTNFTGHLWASSGDGIFDNPALLNTVYHPGAGDINAGSVNLTLTGYPQAPCITNVSDGFTITFLSLPDVTFAPIENFCHNSPPYQLTEGSPAGGVYSGTAVINGWFYPETAGIGTHILYYTYTDNNGCINFAGREVTVDDCTAIDDISAETVSVVPNPGNGIFRIHLDAYSGTEFLMKVHNAGGKLMISQTIIASGGEPVLIDLSTQPEGIYYLTLAGIGETICRKLLILR